MITVIFGAGGFIGRSVTKALSAAEAELILFDMRFTEGQRDHFRCFKGNFSSPADPEPVVKNQKN